MMIVGAIAVAASIAAATEARGRRLGSARVHASVTAATGKGIIVK